MFKKPIRRKLKGKFKNYTVTKDKISTGKGSTTLLIFDFCPIFGFSFITKTIRS